MKTIDNISKSKYCCGQPPRLISGEGFGYALVCMECGNGLKNSFHGSTFQTANALWNRDFDICLKPKPTDVAFFLLRELNDAHEVLRSLACVLGAGGYNATDVDVKVFGAKIHDGINMLVNPLMDRIDKMAAELKQLRGEETPVVTSPHSDTVSCKLSLNGCSYELKKNGMVDVTIQSSGRGFSRHIRSVGRDVQEAFEAHLSKKVKNLGG